MSEAVKETEKAPKKSWFKGLKSEFGKIIWPDKQSLVKQSVAVLIISIVLGLIIAMLDLLIQHGIGTIIR